MPERQRRAEFHVDVTRAQPEQLRAQQPRDGAGVVQRRADRGRSVRRQRIGEREQFGDGERRCRADPADRLDARRRGAHLVRRIEPERDHRATAAEHRRGGIGIGVDVVFGGGGDVAAFAARAAHDRDLAQAAPDLWLARQRDGDIGERTGGHQRDRGGRCGEQGRDDEVDRMRWRRYAVHCADRQRAEAGFAVEMPCFHGGAPQRPYAARVDGDVRPRGDLAQEACVAEGERGAHVAGDGGDACDVERIARGECEQQHHCIVDAGITVDDDVVSFHDATLYRTMWSWMMLRQVGVIDVAPCEAYFRGS